LGRLTQRLTLITLLALAVIVFPAKLLPSPTVQTAAGQSAEQIDDWNPNLPVNAVIPITSGAEDEKDPIPAKSKPLG
jgi:hypothetical protein